MSGQQVTVNLVSPEESLAVDAHRLEKPFYAAKVRGTRNAPSTAIKAISEYSSPAAFHRFPQVTIWVFRGRIHRNSLA